jgi:hypothetical protein
MFIAPRDRLAAILESEPVELDGEAYVGNYKLNDVSSIRNFIDCEFRFKVYENSDTGEKVIISRNSVGKLAGHFRDGEAYQKSIVHIPKIIENMKFLKEMPMDKKNPKWKKYSYYIIGVKICGEPYTILSVIGHNDKSIYYDQTVFDGALRETFSNAKKISVEDEKYSRLAKILGDIK